jgi:hypothetical protein
MLNLLYDVLISILDHTVLWSSGVLVVIWWNAIPSSPWIMMMTDFFFLWFLLRYTNNIVDELGTLCKELPLLLLLFFIVFDNLKLHEESLFIPRCKKYPSMELRGLFQYLGNQLKKGQGIELVLLQVSFRSRSYKIYNF